MPLPTYLTTKKTFYYNFFPSKAEEEAQRARGGSSTGALKNYDRVLVEIRDIYPPPMPSDPQWPWYITKTIGHYDHAHGMIPLTFIETFEHVLRYWDMPMAILVTNGYRIGVTFWDEIDESIHRKYQGENACLQMMPNDDFVLFCPDDMKAERLNVGNRLALRWDKEKSAFTFKLL